MKLSKSNKKLFDNLLTVIIVILSILVAYYIYIIFIKQYDNNTEPKNNALLIQTTNVNNDLQNNVTNVNNNHITQSTNSFPQTTNVNNDLQNNVDINSIGSKRNHIENFLAYVNEQKFCPNIYNSLSSFWCKFPEKYGNGMLGKFCCTSCYYFISEEIYCGENQRGLYKLCKLSDEDINNLKIYYDTEKENLDFEFPLEKLKNLKNSNVLKMKFDDKYMTIQIIKTPQELSNHENDPTIANSLYKETYTCNQINIINI